MIGNPPYVRQEGLGEDKAAFKALYEVFNSIADLYTYFIERSHVLLRSQGRFSMITANKFMRANYGTALRKFLTEKVRLEKLVDFGELRVFGEAATDPVITISSRNTSSTSIEYVQVKSLNFDKLDSIIKNSTIVLSGLALHGASWSLASDNQQKILDKLSINSIPLGQYANGKIRRGILTGFNEAFVINETIRSQLVSKDAKNAEVIKPFLVGDDIRKYFFNFQNKYLIWTYIGIPIEQYPAIYTHLQQYQTQLEARWDKGNHWWELRHCDYYSDFENPKIIFPNIAKEARFAFDADGKFSNQKTYIIPNQDLYLLSILNTKLSFHWILKNCSIFGDADEGGRAELSYVFMKNLPIHRINFVTSDKNRAYYLDKAKLLYSQCVSKDDQDCMLGFVNHHLSQQPEQSDVVHDLLAFLAETMLDMNKQKRTLQKEFLNWLVTTLRVTPDKDGDKAGIEVLTGKSKLLEYAGDYQKNEEPLAPNALWDIVVKNRPRLGVNPSQAGLRERVLERYEQSLEHVLPLKEQLQRTDNLIDAVVYRLYGLTEEEIRVVEGKG